MQLTGRLPVHVHQMNPGLSEPSCTNLNYTMIPAQLKKAGYRTAMLGAGSCPNPNRMGDSATGRYSL
jgi:hypothetical protein